MFAKNALSLGVAALIATASAAVAAEPLKLGVLYATKTVLGQRATQGNQIATDMINESGGVLGHPLELVTYDSGNMPTQGVSAAQRLLTRDAVKVIVGEINSTVALAVIPIVQAQKAIFVVASAKHPDVTKSGYAGIVRLNSSLSMDNDQFGGVLAKEAAGKKVAVIADNTDYGKLSNQNAKKLLGDQVVFTDFISIQQSDMTALVSNIKASRAEVVLINSFNPEQYGNIIIMLKESGLNPKILMGAGLLSADGVKMAKSAAEGVISAEIYSDAQDNDLNRRFVKAYSAKYGEVPDKVAELAFESIWLVAEAMKKTSTTDDTAAIATAIRKNAWDVPRGSISFDAEGQAIGQPMMVLQVKNSKIVPIDQPSDK